MKTILPLKMIICGLTLLAAGAVHASTVTYDYFGTVANVLGPLEPNFGGAVVGDSVHGTFSYDTAASNFGSASDAGYNAISMSLTIGGLTYSLPTPYIEISLSNEYYWAVGGQTQSFSLALVMADTTAPFIVNDTLLRPPPDLGLVDSSYGDLNFIHGNEANNTHLYFSLDRVVMNTSSVPDTGCTLALFIAGLAALPFFRRTALA